MIDAKYILGGIGAALVAGAIGGHFVQVAGLRAAIATVTQERDQARESVRSLTTANDAFAASIERQNGAVRALEQAARDRETAARASNAAALADAQKKYAAALAGLKRPMPVPGDVCRSADAVLTGAIKARR